MNNIKNKIRFSCVKCHQNKNNAAGLCKNCFKKEYIKICNKLYINKKLNKINNKKYQHEYYMNVTKEKREQKRIEKLE